MILHSKEEHAQVISDFLPNGKTFEAKNIHDSNLRDLLRGFAGEMQTGEGYIKTLEDEYFPDTANIFIDEWESAVGIPDSCLDGTGSDIERRRDIMVKLSASGLQTAEDFVELGAVYGIEITVTPGILEQAYVEAHVDYIGSTTADLRHVMVIDLPESSAEQYFPYSFPMVFGSIDESRLQCIFNKLKQTDTQILFRS